MPSCPPQPKRHLGLCRKSAPCRNKRQLCKQRLLGRNRELFLSGFAEHTRPSAHNASRRLSHAWGLTRARAFVLDTPKATTKNIASSTAAIPARRPSGV